MIIDTHNHAGWKECGLEDFLTNMENYGIAKTWLLSWEADISETLSPMPYETCRDYFAKYPDKFVLGFAPDPRIHNALELLENAVINDNVKVCGEFKFKIDYDDSFAIELFRACARLRLPVVIHLEFSHSLKQSYGGNMEAFENAVRVCSDTVFIGHASDFWSNIFKCENNDNVAQSNKKNITEGRTIEMLRKYPNLYCDISANSGLSALNQNKAFTSEFLIEFQNRVLFGRDYINNKHQEFLQTLDLPKEVLQKIYYQNANNLIHSNTK